MRSGRADWLFRGDPLLHLAARLTGGSWFACALIGAGAYYVVPGAILAAASPHALPAYFSDRTHAVFTGVVLLLGAPAGLVFFGRLPLEMSRLARSRVVRGGGAAVEASLDRIRGWAHRAAVSCVAVLVTITTAATFSHMAMNLRPGAWWGSWENGPAGVVLGTMLSVVLYGVVKAAAALVGLGFEIRRLALQRIFFRPHHPDGYYGLLPGARLTTCLYAFTVLGAAALLVPYYLGYFGLERRPLMALAAAVYAVGAGAITAAPVVAMARTVRRMKHREIRYLERHYASARKALGEAGSHVEMLQRLSTTRDAIEAIQRLPELPFGLRAQVPALVTYALQVGLAARELVRSLGP